MTQKMGALNLLAPNFRVDLTCVFARQKKSETSIKANFQEYSISDLVPQVKVFSWFTLKTSQTFATELKIRGRFLRSGGGGDC